MRSALRRFHSEERGAILLFSLAAVLILLLLAWTVYDAGPLARDKVQIQAAADAAAYSQSAVKARAMNMIAYANVAKRSIVAITALYPSMWLAYEAWMAYQASQCFKWFPNLAACYRFFTNLPQYLREMFDDLVDYAGFWGALVWVNTGGLFGSPSGNVTNYYDKDMLALDNYQKYLYDIEPWWSWVEGVVRGMRNGTTANASFPTPRGSPPSGFPKVVNWVESAINSLSINGSGSYVASNIHDDLPFEKRGGFTRSQLFNGAAKWETMANAWHHKERSSLGAAKTSVVLAGVAIFYLFGYKQFAVKPFGDEGKPWLLKKYRTEGDWLTHTSTLVFAYINKPNRFGSDRKKFGVPKQDYKFQLGPLDQFTYHSSGTWTLAKSEVSYQGDKPNSFRAGWTARMRPIELPGEMADASYDLNGAYHEVLPYLALASLLGIGNFSYITSSIQDFVQMERVTRSFGQSTIEGLGK